MNIDLRTDYLGLELANPLVPSASPLSRKLDTAKALEDAGASALVMHSLFEEEIEADEHAFHDLAAFNDLGHGEADDYLPVHPDYTGRLDAYLEQLRRLKEALDIPVIASLNGVTDGGWLQHAQDLEQAGADALELNIYYVAADIDEPAAAVEQRYVDIVRHVRQAVSLPLCIKLGSQFTSPLHFIRQLAEAGADGVALFNRFYQPDLDLVSLDVVPTLHLSSPHESLLRMHWIAMLHGRLDISLAATGGIHDAPQVAKLLLAGADVTHLCATLLRNGPDYVHEIKRQLCHWMEDNEYASVRQLKGSVSQLHARNPAAFERANYLEVLERYEPPLVVRARLAEPDPNPDHC